jgi:hypothetical protein
MVPGLTCVQRRLLHRGNAAHLTVTGVPGRGSRGWALSAAFPRLQPGCRLQDKLIQFASAIFDGVRSGFGPRPTAQFKTRVVL